MSEVNKGGAAARNAAVKTLITAHADEFNEFLKKERTSRGLTPMPTTHGGGNPDKMREQLRKAEERAAKLREKLGISAQAVH